MPASRLTDQGGSRAGGGMPRRAFLGTLAATAGAATGPGWAAGDEDLVAHVHRIAGHWDSHLAARLVGHANAFKEGDELVGVAAADEPARHRAHELLAHTRLRDIDAHPLFEDTLSAALRQDLDTEVHGQIADWTLAELRRWLLEQPEA